MNYKADIDRKEYVDPSTGLKVLAHNRYEAFQAIKKECFEKALPLPDLLNIKECT